MFANGKGVSFDNRWTLNSESILNFEIPYLPLDVQNKIVSIVDEKCSQIDKLINQKQIEIKKLQEYKKSLIYEYITGKRKCK